MHKKGKVDSKLPYDIHIVEALKNLPVPLLTFDGHKVYFDKDKRNEVIYEHIAKKTHHLHLKDIEQIQKILKNKDSLKKDRIGKKFRSYIAKRSKGKERLKLLKITTKLKKNNDESIVTIYPVKKS